MAVVDTFDGELGTPSLAQMQAYNVVVPFSDSSWANQSSLGDNLADYLASGGVVVACNFDWYTGEQGITGRWLSNNYTPFNNSSSTQYSSSLGTYVTTHPFMQGVSILNSNNVQPLVLNSGASQVALWNNEYPLIAYKGNAVGINAYVGDHAVDEWNGQYGKVVVNAGHFLAVCIPTLTPTVSPTPTFAYSSLGKPVLAPVPATLAPAR